MHSADPSPTSTEDWGWGEGFLEFGGGWLHLGVQVCLRSARNLSEEVVAVVAVAAVYAAMLLRVPGLAICPGPIRWQVSAPSCTSCELSSPHPSCMQVRDEGEGFAPLRPHTESGPAVLGGARWVVCINGAHVWGVYWHLPGLLTFGPTLVPPSSITLIGSQYFGRHEARISSWEAAGRMGRKKKNEEVIFCCKRCSDCCAPPAVFWLLRAHFEPLKLDTIPA